MEVVYGTELRVGVVSQWGSEHELMRVDKGTVKSINGMMIDGWFICIEGGGGVGISNFDKSGDCTANII